MSVETVQQFMEKASKDEGLAGKVEAAGTDAAALIALGKEQGCEFTVQDMADTVKESTGAELSDEDLENVAGGFAVIGTVAALSLAASAGAAAHSARRR